MKEAFMKWIFSKKNIRVWGILAGVLIFPASPLLIAADNGLITQTQSDGSIMIKMKGKPIASIKPCLFTDGMERIGFTKPEIACFYDGFARLPNGSRVAALKTTVTAKGYDLHVRMAMTALKTLEPLSERTYLSMPYGDWAGVPYQLGKKSGTIPLEQKTQTVIAQADPATLSLGPSHALGGLTLQLDAPQLDTSLQNDRQQGQELSVYLTHGESGGKPLDWEAGDYQIFDFSMKFNRKIVSPEDGSSAQKD